MITVLFSMTLRPEAEEDFKRVSEMLTRTTQAEDDGCVVYVFLRQVDSPLEHVLFEQWRDQESLDAHVARLRSLLGPAASDDSYPVTHFRRRLPKAFLDLFSEAAVRRYEVV